VLCDFLFSQPSSRAIIYGLCYVSYNTNVLQRQNVIHHNIIAEEMHIQMDVTDINQLLKTCNKDHQWKNLCTRKH
jgi:hypothetical protein